MAEKFIEVTGLQNVFNVSGNTLDLSNIKSGISNKIGYDSILFMTADENDVQYGFESNSKYIWSRGRLYYANDNKLSSKILEEIPELNDVSISILKDNINDTSIYPLTVWEAVTNKPVLVTEQELSNVEEVVSDAISTISDTLGLNTSFGVDWDPNSGIPEGSTYKEAIELQSSQLSDVEEVIAETINTMKDTLGLNSSFGVDWSEESGIPIGSTYKEAIELSMSKESNDEKVKVNLSEENNTFSLLAVNSSNPTNGSTYEAIYNTGIVINPSLNSIAEGYNNKALGKYSHAEGTNVVAIGTASHAEGINNISEPLPDGTFEWSTGSRNVSCYTDEFFQYFLNGYAFNFDGQYRYITNIDKENHRIIVNEEMLTDGSSNISIILGIANGEGAHAEGMSVASGGLTHAEGGQTWAYGEGSHAEGMGSHAEGTGSHAEGYMTNVIIDTEGYAGHAEGYETIASNSITHVEGFGGTAAGVGSHAEGGGIFEGTILYGGIAYGAGSHIEGGNINGSNSPCLQLNLQYIKNNIFDIESNKIPGMLIYTNGILNQFIWNCTSVSALTGFPLITPNTPHYKIISFEEIQKLNNGNLKTYYRIELNDSPEEDFNGYLYQHVALSEITHVEGINNINNGLTSHIEGAYNIANGEISHIEGEGNITYNIAEHAEGLFNKSTYIDNDTNPPYVNLSLPSGNLWATCNIGADTSIGTGDYYAWGEINTKSYYDWVDTNNNGVYKYAVTDGSTLIKYCDVSIYGYESCTDDLISLTKDDDKAYQQYGGNWQIPTKADFEELLDVPHVYTEINNKHGLLFTADNGNTLFLPLTGFIQKNNIEDTGVGYYWINELNTENPRNAYGVKFASEVASIDNGERSAGLTIRPVSKGGLAKPMHTIHSIGNGSDNEHRSNIIEIMREGDIFINGIGKYDGTNPENALSLQDVINHNDEKVKVNLSEENNTFSLLAVNSSNPVDGSTYEAIYNTGIVINPVKHSVAEGHYTIASGDYSHAEGSINENIINAPIRQLTQAEQTAVLNRYGIPFKFACTNDILDDCVLFKIYDNNDSELINEISRMTISMFDENHIVGGVDLFTVNNNGLDSLSTSSSVTYKFVSLVGAAGQGAHTEGFNTYAAGQGAHTEGNNTVASGDGAHAEGSSNNAYDVRTHVEGVGNIGYGKESHTEGAYNVNSGYLSHVEGRKNTAIGNYIHMEGYGNIVNTTYSHAEGFANIATGTASHVEGQYTNAQNIAEHAEGIFNKSHTGSTDADKSIHTVGIGTSELNRKNAFEVMQDGSIYVYGVGNYDGSTLTNASTLQQVISNINGKVIGLGTAAYRDVVSNSITENSLNIPDSSAVYSFVTSKMTSVLTYKGTVGTNGTTHSLPTSGYKQGDVWVVCSNGTYADVSCEVGDYIICNSTNATSNQWDIVSGENQITNNNISLADPTAINRTVNIASVDGTNLTITTPSTWKVTDENVKTNSSINNGNIYLSGATKTTSTTDTQLINASVYMLNGCLYSNKTKVSVEGHEHPYYGYGKIKLVNTTSSYSLLPNNTPINADTINEAVKFQAGNKWIILAGTEHTTNVPDDTIKFGHSLSGVIANGYGQISTATLVHGGTFKVPYINVDVAGHIISASTATLTLPDSGNTDQRLQQVSTTTESYIPLLSANKATSSIPTDTTTTTSSAYFTNTAFIQPSTGNIYSQGYIGVGKTALNTGCNIVYNATDECINFQF